MAVEFTDQDSGSRAAAIMRGADGRVALGLLISGSADLELALTADDCERLVHALQAALDQARHGAA